MKRLPPAKRNQLIGVVIATLALICMVYFLLISRQNAKNYELGVQIGKETARLAQYEKVIKQLDATTNALAELNQQLAHAEEDIASGDLFAWSYDTIRRFKTPYKLDIPTPGQPISGECDLIGGFPYKQIRFSLTGTGFYHELGKFVSDFENKYPHCRVLNLAADPAGGGPTTGERLNFRMDIVALVKPNNQ